MKNYTKIWKENATGCFFVDAILLLQLKEEKDKELSKTKAIDINTIKGD